MLPPLPLESLNSVGLDQERKREGKGEVKDRLVGCLDRERERLGFTQIKMG